MFLPLLSIGLSIWFPIIAIILRVVGKHMAKNRTGKHT